MKKILVGRPRIGSYLKNFEVRDLRGIKPSENDEAPLRLSMRPKGSFNRGAFQELPLPRSLRCRKFLNENLKPLERFLYSKVGLPWDLVYSEIRKANPLGTAVSEHIYDHLYDYVKLHIFYIDGAPHFSGRYGLYPCRYLYVDQAGILQKAPPDKPNKNQTVTRNEGVYDLREIKQGKETIRLLVRREDQVWFSETPFRTLSKKEKKRYKLAS